MAQARQSPFIVFCRVVLWSSFGADMRHVPKIIVCAASLFTLEVRAVQWSSTLCLGACRSSIIPLVLPLPSRHTLGTPLFSMDTLVDFLRGCFISRAFNRGVYHVHR